MLRLAIQMNATPSELGRRLSSAELSEYVAIQMLESGWKPPAAPMDPDQQTGAIFSLLSSVQHPRKRP